MTCTPSDPSHLNLQTPSGYIYFIFYFLKLHFFLFFHQSIFFYCFLSTAALFHLWLFLSHFMLNSLSWTKARTQYKQNPGSDNDSLPLASLIPSKQAKSNIIYYSLTLFSSPLPLAALADLSLKYSSALRHTNIRVALTTCRNSDVFIICCQAHRLQFTSYQLSRVMIATVTSLSVNRTHFLRPQIHYKRGFFKS